MTMTLTSAEDFTIKTTASLAIFTESSNNCTGLTSSHPPTSIHLADRQVAGLKRPFELDCDQQL